MSNQSADKDRRDLIVRLQGAAYGTSGVSAEICKLLIEAAAALNVRSPLPECGRWEPVTEERAHNLRKHQGVPLLPDGCLVVMRSVNGEDGECVGHEIFTCPIPAERPERLK